MRRAFSILFVVLFGLGPLAATIDGRDDASLPACCRRHGAHHCAMSSMAPSQSNQADAQAPVLTTPSHCPMFPQGNASPSPIAVLARSPLAALPSVQRAQSLPANTTCPTRIHLRTPTLRGPPAFLLA